MTPPFGYNLFLMRAMAPKEITMPDIYTSIIPLCFCYDIRTDSNYGFSRYSNVVT